MSVAAVADYHFPARDRVANFRGKQILYVYWEKHALFSRPMALCLAPETPFSTIVDTYIPNAYSFHPDFAHIDWDAVTWVKGGQPFHPDPASSLADNGLTHKALIRFTTPGLNGLNGSGR